MADDPTAFFAQLYAHTVEESANQVLVGLPDAEKRSRAELNARADRLTREWGIPFNLRTRLARRYQGGLHLLKGTSGPA